MRIQHLIKTFLDYLYPAYCIACQVLTPSGHVWCERCRNRLVRPPVYRVMLARRRQLVVHAAGAYAPPLQRLVMAKTYRMRSAAVLLGLALAEALAGKARGYDLLLPVPMHWSRYMWRGYNQAYVMAWALSQQLNIPVVQPFERIKYTRLQRRLGKDQRRTNVSAAFGLGAGWRRRRTRRLLAGQRVLLIDDVYTTGATMHALARLVWQYGPSQVHAAVACRVLD